MSDYDVSNILLPFPKCKCSFLLMYITSNIT